MNEQVPFSIDGRILLALFLILYILGMFIIGTLNVWYKNFEYRRRLGIDEYPKQTGLTKWLLKLREEEK